MEKQIELKINLETARNNPIGFTQWLAMEHLKMGGLSKTDSKWNECVRAIGTLNRFKTKTQKGISKDFMSARRLEFQQYRDNQEPEVTEEFIEIK